MDEKGGSTPGPPKRTSLFSCHRTSPPSSRSRRRFNSHTSARASPHPGSIRERRDCGQRSGACTRGLRKAGKNTRVPAELGEEQTKQEKEDQASRGEKHKTSEHKKT